MSHTYQLNETTVKDNDGIIHTLYGIDAVNNKDEVVKSFTKIFYARSKAIDLVTLCNECELSIIHLENVVDDVLYDQAIAY